MSEAGKVWRSPNCSGDIPPRDHSQPLLEELRRDAAGFMFAIVGVEIPIATDQALNTPLFSAVSGHDPARTHYP
jgi:hypothetical protein